MTELKKGMAGMNAEEAIAYLTKHIESHPGDEDAYVLRGIKHWSAGHRALAINDYLAAIRINPNSRANEALKSANAILDYRNKDLYNP